jgi:hypothetical protein
MRCSKTQWQAGKFDTRFVKSVRSGGGNVRRKIFALPLSADWIIESTNFTLQKHRGQVEGTGTVRSYLQNLMEESTYATDMCSLFEDSGLLGRDTTLHPRRMKSTITPLWKPQSPRLLHVCRLFNDDVSDSDFITFNASSDSD